jgi:filamentous hemagglutinin family protein
LFIPYPLQAQIIPDTTVNTLVTPADNTFVIDGGTTVGGNLFHSFSQFSLPTGSEAFFNNALKIDNIISRVTGGSISNIDGLIRANGNANLFLINPKGIIFGPNAALNIGGSFLASTANSINFADRTQYSATHPQAQPLLTMSVPVGLGFGNNPGAIRVQGTGNSLTVANPLFLPIDRGSSSNGLRVMPGKTLALVGGGVVLEGGTLKTEGGRIELGSVAEGVVSLSATPVNWTLGYNDVRSFRNIQLSQRASADASGDGGSIQVQGANVTLTDGSVMLIQNQGSQSAGSISVNAAQSLEVSGSSPDGSITSSLVNETLGAGNGGDIGVSTQRLVVRDGGSIRTTTFSSAPSGNITLNASDSLQVIGFAPINPDLLSFIVASTGSSGKAGNITVSTGRFTALDGGFVTSGTSDIGNGGNVTVTATESVELIGVNPFNLTPSSLGASTTSQGSAGNLAIDTQRLVLRDGGRVDASTGASGQAGSVTVNASESVEVSGTVPGSLNPSLIISSANIVDESIRRLFGLPDQPSGDSGNVTINTGRLKITDGAQVTVRNDGTGSAGILTVNADSIVLDNQGGITAVSGIIGERENEANITLNVRNSLQMRHNSVISAEARGDQRGGNIIINAGAIAAVPEENSDITASAPQGTGGRITINTQGIFGFKVTQEPTPTSSDITAFGKNPEFNGIVQTNTPEINVQGALNQLNGNFITTEQAIASSCFARRNVEQGTFTVTGTGGLPTTPYDAIGGRYAVTQVQGLPNSARQQTSSPTPNPPSPPTQSWKLGDPIQEAQGMSITPDGRIIVGTNPQLAAIADPQTLICHPTEVHQ